MDRLRRFNDIFRLLVATAISAGAAITLDRLEQLLKNRSVAWIVLLVAVAIAVFVLDQANETLLDHSAKLRRWLLGDQFIEGNWFDISIDRVKGSVHHGSFITIAWRGGEFIVNGIEFDPLGNRICTFRSTSTSLVANVLTFSYESHSDTFESVVEIGIDQLQFDAPPQSYSGFYFDFTKTVDFRVQGQKIDLDIAATYNHFQNLADKKRFILAQIAESERELRTSAVAKDTGPRKHRGRQPE
jgi:hypothetical protein